MYTDFNYKKFLASWLLILPLTLLAEVKKEQEPNNIVDDAQWIIVNDFAQANKFDYIDDEDWLVFYAQEGMLYDIEIESNSVGQGINPALEILVVGRICSYA